MPYLKSIYASQKAHSSTSFADKFTLIVLLIHGENNGSNRAIQSLKMHLALKNKNKNSSHIEIRDENSSFTTDQSRTKVFTIFETFIAEHLQ